MNTHYRIRNYGIDIPDPHGVTDYALTADPKLWCSATGIAEPEREGYNYRSGSYTFEHCPHPANAARTTEETLLDVLHQYVPKYQEQYIANVRRLFTTIQAKLPGDAPESISSKVINDWTFAKQFVAVLRGNVKFQDLGGIFRKGGYVLHEERITVNAQDYAEAVIRQFAEKLANKLGSVTKVEVISHHHANIEIVGWIGDHRVHITQQMILNSSKHGVLYNQFPALIYLDGKNLSEKTYKEMTAHE